MKRILLALILILPAPAFASDFCARFTDYNYKECLKTPLGDGGPDKNYCLSVKRTQTEDCLSELTKADALAVMNPKKYKDISRDFTNAASKIDYKKDNAWNSFINKSDLDAKIIAELKTRAECVEEKTLPGQSPCGRDNYGKFRHDTDATKIADKTYIIQLTDSKEDQGEVTDLVFLIDNRVTVLGSFPDTEIDGKSKTLLSYYRGHDVQQLGFYSIDLKSRTVRPLKNFEFNLFDHQMVSTPDICSGMSKTEIKKNAYFNFFKSIDTYLLKSHFNFPDLAENIHDITNPAICQNVYPGGGE